MRDPIAIINANGTTTPWAVCDEPKNDQWHKGYTIHGHGKRVADVANHYFPETAIVVANMIAAAPDMFYVLQCIMDEVGSSSILSIATKEQAKAALAKARGQ